MTWVYAMYRDVVYVIGKEKRYDHSINRKIRDSHTTLCSKDKMMQASLQEKFLPVKFNIP